MIKILSFVTSILLLLLFYRVRIVRIWSNKFRSKQKFLNIFLTKMCKVRKVRCHLNRTHMS